MPWLHYTAPLAAEEVITMAQYHELLDAVAERIEVIGGSFTGLADLKASGLLARTVRWTPPGGSATNDTLAGILLNSLSVRYAVSDTAPTCYTATTLRDAILADLGLTATQWSAILAQPLDDRRYWNALRKAVQLLGIPTYSFSPGPLLYSSPEIRLMSVDSSGVPDGYTFPWSAVVDAWPEWEGPWYEPLNWTNTILGIVYYVDAADGGPGYRGRQYRQLVAGPSIPSCLLNDAGVHFYMLGGVTTNFSGRFSGPHTYVPDTVYLTVGGGAPASVYAATPATGLKLAGGTLYSGPNQILTFWLGGWDDIAPYDPGTEIVQTTFTATAGTLYTQPAFTHP